MVDRFLGEVYQWATVSLPHARSGFSVGLMILENLFSEKESSDDLEEPPDRLRALVASVLKFPSDVRGASGTFDLPPVEGVASDKALVGVIAVALEDALEMFA